MPRTLQFFRQGRAQEQLGATSGTMKALMAKPKEKAQSLLTATKDQLRRDD
jgi:hypothetical protein